MYQPIQSAVQGSLHILCLRNFVYYLTVPDFLQDLFTCLYLFRSRRKDKLRYRYPRGESYLDVIQRLEPVIIELERQRAPVVVIAHQAVLRSLYAYFADKPLEEVPKIEIPLHTIIEIKMGVTGVEEKRYKLMDDPTAGT